jgi:hypothetical protein
LRIQDVEWMLANWPLLEKLSPVQIANESDASFARIMFQRRGILS